METSKFPDTLKLTDFWTAASVILGFQVTTFLWRVANEVTRNRENKNRDLIWLPAADMLNLLAMCILVLGVFIAPMLGWMAVQDVPVAFGLALLLFVGHCFAIAGHYDMYNRHTYRSMRYFPFQEKIVVGIFLLASILYLSWMVLS